MQAANGYSTQYCTEWCYELLDKNTARKRIRLGVFLWWRMFRLLRVSRKASKGLQYRVVLDKNIAWKRFHLGVIPWPLFRLLDESRKAKLRGMVLLDSMMARMRYLERRVPVAPLSGAFREQEIEITMG